LHEIYIQSHLIYNALFYGVLRIYALFQPIIVVKETAIFEL